jgi:hypothetical protein
LPQGGWTNATATTKRERSGVFRCARAIQSSAFAHGADVASAPGFTGTRCAPRSTSDHALRSESEPPSSPVMLLANWGTRHQVVPVL